MPIFAHPRIPGALAALLLAGWAGAAEQELLIDPAASRVTFTLDSTWHTVKGGFAFKSGAIAFDLASGEARGTVVLDATSAVTGNHSRDQAMHGKVLESRQYPEIAFSAQRIEARLDGSGAGAATLHGRVSIHGAEHELALQATVRRTGDRVTVVGSLPVPYVEWGMEDPSFLLARVAKVVQVSFTAVGTLRETTRAENPPSSSPE